MKTLAFNSILRTSALLALGVLAAISAGGCSRLARNAPKSESHSEIAATETSSSAPQATTAVLDARTGRKPRSASLPEAGSAKAFDGPFPHRSNPFALPNSAQAVAAAKQRATEKRAEERLLGFVDVDGRKALLQIDGKIWTARAGDSRNGIEVVVIAPAHVTLRRSGATWNVALPTRSGSG